MAQTQIADVIVPAEFTAYQVENSLVSVALYESGVLVQNGEMASQLQAGAQQFTVPFWADAGESEADITNDNATIQSVPLKIGAAKQNVRKSFLHQSWSEMSLASELSGPTLSLVFKATSKRIGTDSGNVASSHRCLAYSTPT